MHLFYENIGTNLFELLKKGPNLCVLKFNFDTYTIVL